MNYNTGKPNHIEDYLVRLHTGQWFGWSDSKNKIYDNLIIYDNSKTKPTEEECINGLSELQIEYDNRIAQEKANKQSALNKLKALGLNDAEIKAIIGN
jgi:hypothetical protein